MKLKDKAPTAIERIAQQQAEIDALREEIEALRDSMADIIQANKMITERLLWRSRGKHDQGT